MIKEITYYHLNQFYKNSFCRYENKLATVIFNDIGIHICLGNRNLFLTWDNCFYFHLHKKRKLCDIKSRIPVSDMLMTIPQEVYEWLIDHEDSFFVSLSEAEVQGTEYGLI